ncbi:StbB family protein [Paucibacter sp. DJ2R-2]|uniref:StbB family protein n=1 Tax=unclassified Roseateles TaxID=2626991 RepID=UPI0021E4C0C1|nr:StbB family protein [Paucibacter sp. DJ2R-2]MCV2438708.1 hypothetical protein [Paucibacter sp. DJ2R-2]
MKIAVLSFSGNVGKSTIARHLLAPRLPGAKLISIESINAGEELDHVIRGRQFAELQEFLQIVDDVVVDIGASNIEDLLTLMRRYQGSHEDFDIFIVPAVPAGKQQRDTIATLVELSRLGIPPGKVRVIFNMVEDDSELERQFEPLLAFLQQSPMARVSLACQLGFNEIYGRLNGPDVDLVAVASDSTDYKALIKNSADNESRLAHAQGLATQRLARGVLPKLDACFHALNLRELVPSKQG